MMVKGTKKIMVFGTFDGLHKGHLDFFKQAKDLMKNSSLIVSIARDINVLKIKGRKPVLTEKKRLYFVKKSGLPDKVILGNLENYFFHIRKEKPDIIALGYDQRAYVEELKRDLKKYNLSIKIKRLKPYKQHIYKSHLLKKKR